MSKSPSPLTAAPTRLTYKRPWLYDKQLEAIFCPERYAIIEASTKAGKTIGCIAWLVEQAWSGKANRHYWWVAPIYRQARIAYKRIKNGLTPGSFTSNESDLSITLRNGAVLEFKGADNPDSLYGEDVYAAVIDEFTRCREEAFVAIRSTLTQTRGPIRLIGNVKGRKNWGYRLARLAESGEPNMRFTKITAYDAAEAGIFPIEEIEDAKRTLPDAVFRELYLAEPSDDGGNPFGITAISAAVVPLTENPVDCWGVDLAKSVDWTVAIGLDADGAVCRFERWQGPWPETTRRLAALIGNAPALIDSTGVGDPVLGELQRLVPAAEGFHFSSSSKQQLMEGLAVAIQQSQVRYPDGPIVAELEAFEYTYTRTGVRYSAPEGLHDDCVCALALAVHHHRQARLFRRGDIVAAVQPDLSRDEGLFA